MTFSSNLRESEFSEVEPSEVVGVVRPLASALAPRTGMAAVVGEGSEKVTWILRSITSEGGHSARRD